MSGNEEIGLLEKPKKTEDILEGPNIVKDKLESNNEDKSLNKLLKSVANIKQARTVALLQKYKGVYEWLENNIKEICEIWSKEFGSPTITLWIYFLELRKAVHDCIQIKFGFNNVILNIRRDAGDYRSYLTCSLINKTSPEKRVDINSPSLNPRDILKQFYNDFMDKLPSRQIVGLTKVYPEFISKFGPDGDPYLTVDLTFERGSGTYAKLFFDQRDRYRSYSYQPIYADQEREVCTIIVRPEECLDIDETIREIAKMADCERNDVTILGRVELEIDIEDTPFVGGPIAACDPGVMINAIRFGGIDNDIVRKYVYGCENVYKILESSGASAIIKGKDKKGIQNGTDHHLLDMLEVALDKVSTGENYPISRSDFGFNKSIVYGDTIPIPPDLATHFQDEYKKYRFNKIKALRYE